MNNFLLIILAWEKIFCIPFWIIFISSFQNCLKTVLKNWDKLQVKTRLFFLINVSRWNKYNHDSSICRLEHVPCAINPPPPNLLTILLNYIELFFIYFVTCKDLDPCQSSPCNEGRCQNMQNGYICDCPEEYTGINCEECKDNFIKWIFII